MPGLPYYHWCGGFIDTRAGLPVGSGHVGNRFRVHGGDSQRTEEEPAAPPPPPVIAPITARQRIHWIVNGTVGPRSLLVVGPLSAAWSTAWNSPEEWGQSWSGFGKRYLQREANVAISNTIEAGLGAIWGEDPRFVPSHRQGIWPRARFAMKTVVLAPRRDGHLAPAWGRYAGNGVQQHHREHVAAAERDDARANRARYGCRTRRAAGRQPVGRVLARCLAAHKKTQTVERFPRTCRVVSRSVRLQADGRRPAKAGRYVLVDARHDKSDARSWLRRRPRRNLNGCRAIRSRPMPKG